jgi:hypothetical protein
MPFVPFLPLLSLWEPGSRCAVLGLFDMVCSPGVPLVSVGGSIWQTFMTQFRFSNGALLESGQMEHVGARQMPVRERVTQLWSIIDDPLCCYQSGEVLSTFQ